MDKRLDRIDGKLDDIQKELVEIKLGYAIHERRSLANEAAVVILREEFKPVLHVLLQVQFMHKLIMAAAFGLGIIYTILEIRSLL